VRAQSTQANALYDARRAEVALVRAVGTDPWGTGETP
jgi:outer membrane protein TolC